MNIDEQNADLEVEETEDGLEEEVLDQDAETGEDVEGALEGVEDEAEPQKAVDPNEERRARENGWVPKEEWMGDPELWKPAEEFNRIGDEINAVMRSKLERSEAKSRALEDRMMKQAQENEDKEREFEKRIRRMEAMNAKSLELQRQKFWDDKEAQKEAAAAEGDMDAYNRAKKEQVDGLEQFDEPEIEEIEDPKPKTQALPQEVQDWLAKEDWFTKPEMRHVAIYAEHEHKRLLKAAPGLSLKENLERAGQKARQKFPEEFGIEPSERETQKQRRAHAPAQHGGGRQATTSGNGKTWNDIPSEDRKMGLSHIEEGLFKNKEEWAKEYWAQ